MAGSGVGNLLCVDMGISLVNSCAAARSACYCADMAKRDRDSSSQKRRAGLLFALMGFAIINLGVLALLQGRLHYANYWGGAVFAPFALLGGLLVIVIAVRLYSRKTRR